MAEKAGDASDMSGLFPEDLQELVHDLPIYRIELERQNEELRHTQLASAV